MVMEVQNPIQMLLHMTHTIRSKKKLECLGHIQKRLGTRLRKLKTTNKSALLDGTPIGGKGQLTDKTINKL